MFTKRILLSIKIAVAAVTGLAAVARAGVLVVDAAGGGGFNSIQAAVGVALDGDVILVRSGNYSAFMVNDLSVAIVADTGATVNVAGAITLNGLSANKTIILDRLNASGITSLNDSLGYGLVVSHCLGAVRVQGCTLVGASGVDLVGLACSNGQITRAWDAVRSLDCADVAFGLCALRGGRAGNELIFNADFIEVCWNSPACCGDDGGRGLFAQNSTVTIYDSIAIGGHGGNAVDFGGRGGNGIHAEQSTLFCCNVSSTGGDGGGVGDYIGVVGSPGGFGAFLDGTSLMRTLAVALVGGHHGFTITPNPGPLDPAFGGAGTWIQIPGDSKGFGMPKALRENQSTTLVLTGNPGEAGWLMISAGTFALFAPGLHGTLLLELAGLIGPLPLGTVDGVGKLTVPVTMPQLPSGLLAAELWLQGIVVSPSGNGTLTGWSHLTLLDSTL